jgi:hypothetical protein
VVGLVDDFLNLKQLGHKGHGFRFSFKVWLYAAVALIGALWFYYKLGFDFISVPLLGTFHIGWWFVPFFILAVIGISFSVNLTDGLDGLAGGVLLICFFSLAIIAFWQGKNDLTSLLGVICGGLLAFLWFNVYPARFFMGDKEPFKVRLPVASEKMGVDVHAYFRLLRARDVDRLAALNRIMHSVNGSEAKTVSTRIPRKQGTVKIENVKIDNSITENLASLVVSVDGITDPDLISKFLTNCHMGDSIAIRQALSDNTPGVDVLIEITCPHCDAKSIRPLPLTETFFRPKATVVD